MKQIKFSSQNTIKGTRKKTQKKDKKENNKRSKQKLMGKTRETVNVINK